MESATGRVLDTVYSLPRSPVMKPRSQVKYCSNRPLSRPRSSRIWARRSSITARCSGSSVSVRTGTSRSSGDPGMRRMSRKVKKVTQSSTTTSCASLRAISLTMRSALGLNGVDPCSVVGGGWWCELRLDPDALDRVAGREARERVVAVRAAWAASRGRSRSRPSGWRSPTSSSSPTASRSARRMPGSAPGRSAARFSWSGSLRPSSSSRSISGSSNRPKFTGEPP